MALNFRVLGGIKLRRDGTLVELGHQRRRCVLATMLIDANRVVSIDQLVDRIVGSARSAFEQRFCERTATRLGAECTARLEAPVDDKDGRHLLAELKSDPGQVGLETLLREIDKVAAVRQLELPPDLFSDASEKLVDAWRARAARSYPSDLRAAAAPVRLTLLAALCWRRASEITDALVDLTLRELVKEAKANERMFQARVRTVLRGSYSNHYRRMLPPLLAALTLRCNNTAYRPVMQALELLQRHAGVDGKVRT